MPTGSSGESICWKTGIESNCPHLREIEYFVAVELAPQTEWIATQGSKDRPYP